MVAVLRANLNALLLLLACSQSVFAQDGIPLPTTVTVGPGDSATALAQRLRPESATLEQTLAALWRANPRAFGNGNLNQLLQGATLQVPSERDILRLSAAQAHTLVVEQVRNIGTFARQQPSPASAASAANPHLNTAQWERALTEAQALKEALERQSRDTQSQLAQLEKSIQALQTLQAASSPASDPGEAEKTLPTPVEPAAVEASAPEPKASDPASEPANATLPMPLPAPLQTFLWSGIVLGLLLLVILVIRQRRHAMPPVSADAIKIPPQMASIDLNLDLPVPRAAPKQDPHL